MLKTWCRVLLEKLTGLQLVKKFPEFHGTRKFITALTSVRHLSLPWVSPVQSICPHPTSCRSILILSTHLCLGHPSGLLPSGFPSKNIYLINNFKTACTLLFSFICYSVIDSFNSVLADSNYCDDPTTGISTVRFSTILHVRKGFYITRSKQLLTLIG